MKFTYKPVDTRFILFRIADAIESGVIILGQNASIGQYQTATGDNRYCVMERNTDTMFINSIESASKFIEIEGAFNATRALNKAIS